MHGATNNSHIMSSFHSQRLAAPGQAFRRGPRTRRRLPLLALTVCLGAAFAASLHAATSDTPGQDAPSSDVFSALRPAPPPSGTLRYDVEYPSIGYSGEPRHNPIARLQERLDRGEIELAFHPTRGYLDAVLKALGIDSRSQALVYSKTSLQFEIIRADTPRAIYFNDDTYVAWIPGTGILEIGTMDARLGPVFYTLPNGRSAGTRFERETLRCLNCHDTFGLAGGGVPRFVFLSTLVTRKGEALTRNPGKETTDQTPIRDRWGGWYVTGQHGQQVHLGNILVDGPEEASDIDRVRRGNLTSLAGLFDTKPYITDQSDIVALLVLEHQMYVQNLITRTNYKSRTLLERQAGAPPDEVSWDALPPRTRRALQLMLEPLVRALLFAGAAEFENPIRSSSGFDTWIEAQGPRAPDGRSLRELDLNTRLFKHRLSYVIYSEAFDNLPAPVRDHVLTRLADILSGRDKGTEYAYLPTAERQAIYEILSATEPSFAAIAKARRAYCERRTCAG